MQKSNNCAALYCHEHSVHGNFYLVPKGSQHLSEGTSRQASAIEIRSNFTFEISKHLIRFTILKFTLRDNQ